MYHRIIILSPNEFNDADDMGKIVLHESKVLVPRSEFTNIRQRSHQPYIYIYIYSITQVRLRIPVDWIRKENPINISLSTEMKIERRVHTDTLIERIFNATIFTDTNG